VSTPIHLTSEENAQLAKAFARELENPPTIGVVGISGTSKSSTINTLFKTNLAVSHTTACTKQFEANQLQLRINQGQAQGYQTKLVVYDAPGLGEDVRKDPEYLAMYRKTLPTCDVILWVTSARNRAVALDQTYLANFRDLHDRMVFGLSQVDLVEPMNWKPGLPIPSAEQEAFIAEIVADRSKRIGDILGRTVKLIPYSNYKGFNLEELFAGLIGHVQGDRAWIFAGLKNFSYKQFLPKS
jgi:predicted GTPase